MLTKMTNNGANPMTLAHPFSPQTLVYLLKSHLLTSFSTSFSSSSNLAAKQQ